MKGYLFMTFFVIVQNILPNDFLNK